MSFNYNVKAKYIEHAINEHQNNPFIAALPDFLAHKKELQKLLTTMEKIKEEELSLPEEHRKVIGEQRLNSFFKPLQIHIDLFCIIIKMIYDGYINRSPIRPVKHNAKYEWQQYNVIDSDPITMPKIIALIGDSGVGKSELMNRIQRLFPAVIEHVEYQGIRLDLTYQIPIIKIQTISSGTTKSVCEAIIAEFDRLLGGEKQYFSRTNKRSANTLIQDIKTYVRIHAVGLIIFDEFQNIHGLKRGNQEEVKNFILQLTNELKVPMIFIGTPRARSLVEQELRIGRRICQQDVYRWSRMKNNNEWKSFIKSLFGIQYIKNRTKPTQEVIDCLYEETQGITALVVTLYRIVQERAIDIGTETITIPLIKSVAIDTFLPIRNILLAIKSEDPEILKQYKDIDYIDELAMSLDNRQKKSNSFKKKIKTKKDAKLLDIQNKAIVEGKLTYDAFKDTGNIADSNEFED